jgi:hypothetical protein
MGAGQDDSVRYLEGREENREHTEEATLGNL